MIALPACVRLTHPAENFPVLEIDHPVEGRVKALGFPVKLSGTPQRVRYPAPLLGQHTDEVLGEFGLDAATVTRLRAQGAFGAPARAQELERGAA